MREVMRVRKLSLSAPVAKMSWHDVASYTCQYVDEDFVRENYHYDVCDTCAYKYHDCGMLDCACGMDYTDYNCRHYGQYAQDVRVYLIEADMRLRKVLGDLWEDEYSVE